MAVYKRGRGFELGTTVSKSSSHYSCLRSQTQGIKKKGAASFQAFGLLSKHFSLDITSPDQYKCCHAFRVLKTLTFKTKPSENTFLVKIGCPQDFEKLTYNFKMRETWNNTSASTTLNIRNFSKS